MAAAANSAGAEHFLQGEECRAFLTQQQDSRGLAVKPVRKFEKMRIRPLPSQGLDDPKTFATAAMHGDTGRLVDGQQAFVFKNNGEMHLEFGASDHFLFDSGDSQRRDTQHIATLQSIGNLHTPTVDSYLTATHDAVNMALGHPFAFFEQQVGEALSVLILGDSDVHAEPFPHRAKGRKPRNHAREGNGYVTIR